MKAKYWLISILIIAAFLRLYGLNRGDTVNDEASYAFRGLGWIDFDYAPLQTTPLEWFNPSVPWWTKLSFHDHPLLVFAAEGFFMQIFGEHAWAFRLPSALLGIISVYLIYLLGSLLFSQISGLLAAAIFAVSLNNVYISRVGLQESYVIFFMLLANYFFLKAVGSKAVSNFKGNPHPPAPLLKGGGKKKRFSLFRGSPVYLIWTGATLGLAFLTKYTTFVLVPIFVTYLLIYKRNYFKNKKFWLGLLLVVLIFSPVLVYNYELYKSVGHFDFQFSFIFHQNHPEWQIEPGKDIGTIGDRLKNFIPRLIASNSWLFLILFTASLWYLRRNIFLLVTFFYLILLLVFIGPSYRFLTMLTPWMALSAGVFWPKKKIFLYFLIPVFLFEIFYTWNNQISFYPIGPFPWLASKVRYENYNWGYNALEKYLTEELNGKMPALTFKNKYKFLNDIQDKSLTAETVEGLKPYPATLIYYGYFDGDPKLWIFDRLQLYHGWPIVSFEEYQELLRQNGANFYKNSGFKNFYFIASTNIVQAPDFRAATKGFNPIEITNPRGETAFWVYKF